MVSPGADVGKRDFGAPALPGLAGVYDRFAGTIHDVISAPDRIRTCDLRFRRPTLYPTELRALCRVFQRLLESRRSGQSGSVPIPPLGARAPLAAGRRSLGAVTCDRGAPEWPG